MFFLLIIFDLLEAALTSLHCVIQHPVLQVLLYGCDSLATLQYSIA